MTTDTVQRLDRTSHVAEAPGTDAATILDTVRAVAPSISARSDEIEAGRRLPPDLVEQLRTAGCFRMLVPTRLGGGGAELADHVQMIQELARADGSVGWTVMIGSSGPVVLRNLGRSTFDAIYANGPDVVSGGSFNPTGVATPVPGGFRASGRWAFVSGSQHAEVFIAHCMVDDGRLPPLRLMVVPAGDVEIIDTWTVSGLCGTGSHDMAIDDLFVPDGRTCSIFEPLTADLPLGRTPELVAASLSIAAVALGIAEGALAEVTTLATAKVPMLADSTLAANPWFRHQLGDADAHVRAAGALLHADAAAMTAIARRGEEPTPEQRARCRGTATWVTAAAAQVVDAAYTAGGGTALYRTSPLQRRLRDVHAITQHFAVKSDTFTLAGAVLAGEDVDLSFL